MRVDLLPLCGDEASCQKQDHMGIYEGEAGQFPAVPFSGALCGAGLQPAADFHSNPPRPLTAIHLSCGFRCHVGQIANLRPIGKRRRPLQRKLLARRAL
jgi:hypothetical protein